MPFQFSCLSATERRSTAAKRDDLHYKSLFLVKKIQDNGTQKAVQSSVWESCYAKKKFGTFGVEMRASGQKLVKCCTLIHTLTHAAKLVVRMHVYQSFINYHIY